MARTSEERQASFDAFTKDVTRGETKRTLTSARPRLEVVKGQTAADRLTANAQAQRKLREEAETIAREIGSTSALLGKDRLTGHLRAVAKRLTHVGRNEIPADKKTLLVALQSANKTGEKPLPDHEVKKIADEAFLQAVQMPTAPPVRWRKPSELDRTPISYLVENMIPAGWLGAVGGKDGRGKTLLCLELAKCVLTGEPLFGEFAVKKGKVFAMLLDDPENLVSDRMEILGILDHKNLRVATKADVDMKDPAGMLAFMVEQLADQKPTLILIDALYLFIPAGGHADKANSAGAMTPVMVALDEVANKTGATVALVAHDNKAGADIAGSAVIRQMMKWILRVILPKEYEDDPEGGVKTKERILQLNKLKTGRTTSWYLELNGPGDWSFEGDSDTHRKATLRDRVLFFIMEHGDSTLGELRHGLRSRNEETLEACVGLVNDGELVKTDRPREKGKGRGSVAYSIPLVESKFDSKKRSKKRPRKSR